jgi:hypothetical protein
MGLIWWEVSWRDTGAGGSTWPGKVVWLKVGAYGWEIREKTAA